MSDVEADTTEDNNATADQSVKPNYQYLLYFVTLVILSGIHTSLSVTILPMTGIKTFNETATDSPNLTNPDTILSACFWTHFIPHIFGTKLIQLMNPKWIILFSIFLQSVFNLSIPPMADYFGSPGVITCRVLQGLCQGFLFAAFCSLINIWASPSEKHKILTIVFSGCILGTTVGMPLAGALAGSETGWPLVFYFYGSVGLLWGIIFAVLGKSKTKIVDVNISRNNGEDVQSMSEVDNNSRNETGDLKGRITVENQEISEVDNVLVQSPTPWISLICSKPLWAILLSSAAHCFGSSILLTNITIYINNVLNFSLAGNGFFSAIPYFFQLILDAAIILTHKIINNSIINLTNRRKLYNSLGLFLPASAFMALAFIDPTAKEAAIVFLVIAISSTIFAQSGYLLNVIDIAPNYTAILFVLVNTVGSIFETLGPLTVGFYEYEKNNVILWRHVFSITASMYLIAGTFYCIFASAEVQVWNSKQEDFENNFLNRIIHFCRKHYTTIKNHFISCFAFDNFCFSSSNNCLDLSLCRES